MTDENIKEMHSCKPIVRARSLAPKRCTHSRARVNKNMNTDAASSPCIVQETRTVFSNNVVERNLYLLYKYLRSWEIT